MREKWKVIYKICNYSVIDNNVIWLQYRILYGILGTREYLNKLKISRTSICVLCNQHDEDIDHLLYKCKEVKQLWNNVQQWIKNKLAINLEFTTLMKTLGYLETDNNFWPINLILMSTRKYIFWCSKNAKKPNMFYLQKEIKKIYYEQRILSILNCKPETFNKRWFFWKNIFNEIET